MLPRDGWRVFKCTKASWLQTFLGVTSLVAKENKMGQKGLIILITLLSSRTFGGPLAVETFFVLPEEETCATAFLYSKIRVFFCLISIYVIIFFYFFFFFFFFFAFLNFCKACQLIALPIGKQITF